MVCAAPRRKSCFHLGAKTCKNFKHQVGCPQFSTSRNWKRESSTNWTTPRKCFDLNIKICRIFLLGNVRKHGTTSRRSTTCPVCDGAWQIARGRSDLVPYGLDVISKRADKHITSTLGRRGGAKISSCFANTHVDIILLLPLERLYLCFPVSNNSSLRC